MPRKQCLSRRSKNWKRQRTAEIRSNLVCSVSIPLGSVHSGHEVLRNHIQSYGTLPNGWMMNSVCTDYIQLCNFQPNRPDEVFYSMKIKKDLTWLLFVCGQKVVSKALTAFPTTINSVRNLIKVFTMIDEQCVICEGNPDAKFKPLALAKGGVFTNMKGTDTVAEMESALLGRETIRHKKCELLLTRGRLNNRCCQCQGHRNSLHVMLKRHIVKRNSSTVVSSHTNYRYMSKTLLSRCTHTLHNKYRTALRRIKRLNKRVKQLVEKHGVKVDKGLSGDLQKIMSNSLALIEKKYPNANSFPRIFWDQHFKAAACKNSKGIRWHPAMIRWCLYLRHLSGRGYEVLRDSGVLQLPSQRTLRDYTHFIPATVGHSEEVDKMLMNTLKVKTCPRHHLYVTVLMDEMHIKEGLVYDKHSGGLVGFTDLGDMNNYLIDLEKSAESLEPLAKSMLVLMVRGILSGFQIPYAQFPCVNLTGEQLYNIFWESVERLERIDIKVLGVTCDGYSVNRRFLKLHKSSSDGDIIYKMPNPFATEKRDVYFISDPPHLIKTVRNCWASKKRDLWCNGKLIAWEHLMDVYKSGTGADKPAPGLSLVPKLKYEHVYLTSYSKMRVDLAAQALSASVANAMEFSGREELKETIKFVRYFDKFFDLLNVTSLTEGKHKLKPFKLPYVSATDTRLSWLQNDFLHYLDQWKKSVDSRPGFAYAARAKMQLSQQTLLGIRITALSFIDLVKFVFTLPDAKFFLSEKISQDPIEKFFGCQRQRGSSNELPTAHEMYKNTQALRVINTACRYVTSVRGNTRGNPGQSGEENMSQPLMKRKRARK